MDKRIAGSMALLLVALTGCATLHRTPAWVANPKAAYPEDRFLAAVGEGDTRRAAENAADANLARIFEARIESDERLKENTRETRKAFERTTDFDTDINILSTQTLYNIQHAEAWTDRSGRVHAIAYLDRRATAALYRDKIDAATARVEFLAAQARASADPLKRYACLRAAVRADAEASALLAQLKVIHPLSASASAPSYSGNDLRKELADAARLVRVGIHIDGDADGRIATAFADFITGYGFVVGQPAVLDISGRIDVVDTGQRAGGLLFVRYDLDARMADAAGNVVAAFSEKGREGHVSFEEARIRALRTIETAIKAGGRARLDAFFGSLVDQSAK